MSVSRSSHKPISPAAFLIIYVDALPTRRGWHHFPSRCGLSHRDCLPKRKRGWREASEKLKPGKHDLSPGVKVNVTVISHADDMPP